MSQSTAARPTLIAPRAFAPNWRWPRTALIAALAIFALVGATYAVLPLLQSLCGYHSKNNPATKASLVAGARYQAEPSYTPDPELMHALSASAKV